ncbi:glycosyl hydrolase [Pseudochryseolinea flava]|uniref:Por secretion system C-terminal sorting domain-containing protein n=1 Tax=Pseudochryseolinea flava TaxID=2059302 RepID=A0A364Y568_9BACT|nr:glycosyl hydrolase [Pseudochryseolinea flava]RAW00967.1 hypothetical protein DQQ10_12055 [Pseudochryseolinea flava]
MKNVNVRSFSILLLLNLLLLSYPGAAQFKSLNFLNSISGQRTVAGQHNREPNANPSQWTNQIYSTTGRYPALWSGDFLFQADNIANRQTMINQAKVEWANGALVNLMYHSCPPTQNEPCNWDGGVVSELSDAQWNELITNGTNLNNRWKARLDVIATYLQDLENNGVEVLFRPFHEMNQGIFWWAGRPGANGTRRLYQITRDYLQNTKGLANLIWVWNVQDFGTLASDLNNYDPGSNYWDVLSLDMYYTDGQGYTSAKYNALVNKAGNKPIAIGECSVLPSSSTLASQPRWTFFMGWAELVFSNNSTSAIQSAYGASNVVTLDEMPGWANVGTGGCTGTGATLPATVQAESYCQMSGVQKETTSDIGGGQNVGYIETNDWMAYRVNVPATGTYTVQYRVASQNGGGSIRLENLGGTTTYGTIAVPATGGWQTWATISHNITLNAGTQDIAIDAAAGGFNLNWISFSGGGGSINLAYNRPVSVSSTEAGGNVASNAVDANGTTRWSSTYSDTQWITVDLGANYNVSRVRVAWETASAKNYYLEGSTNGTTWFNMRTITNNASLVNDHTGLNSTARYVRLYCTARNTTYGYSIYELEVYGAAAARERTSEVSSDVEVLSIYPNPLKGRTVLNVNVDDSGMAVLELINSAGMRALTLHNGSLARGQHAFSFEASTLRPGIYMAMFTFNGKRTAKKFVKE